MSNLFDHHRGCEASFLWKSITIGEGFPMDLGSRLHASFLHEISENPLDLVLNERTLLFDYDNIVNLACKLFVDLGFDWKRHSQFQYREWFVPPRSPEGWLQETVGYAP